LWIGKGLAFSQFKCFISGNEDKGKGKDHIYNNNNYYYYY